MNITRSFPNNAKGTDFKWPMLFLILLAKYTTSFLDCLKIQVKVVPLTDSDVTFKLIDNDIPSPLTTVATFM